MKRRLANLLAGLVVLAATGVASGQEMTESVTILFDTDSAVLGSSAQQRLDETVCRLEPHQVQTLKVVVVSAADERGSDSYNERLAERRGEAVVEHVQECLGTPIPLERRYLGERQPLPRKEGETRAEWLARNRRTTLTVQYSLALPAQIVRFSVDPIAVREGASVSASWEVKNATELEIRAEGSIVSRLTGADVPQGAVQITVAGDTDVTLCAKNAGSSDTATVQIAVLAKPLVEVWTVEPPSAPPGARVLLRWRAGNADSVALFGPEPSVELATGLEPEGEHPVVPRESGTYAIEAVGPGGSSRQTLTYQVEAPEVEVDYCDHTLMLASGVGLSELPSVFGFFPVSAVGYRCRSVPWTPLAVSAMVESSWFQATQTDERSFAGTEVPVGVDLVGGSLDLSYILDFHGFQVFLGVGASYYRFFHRQEFRNTILEQQLDLLGPGVHADVEYPLLGWLAANVSLRNGFYPAEIDSSLTVLPVGTLRAGLVGHF